MLRCLPFLLLATAVQAQHLRELDFHQIYAQSRVAVQEVYSYTCENNLPVDSCLISRTEYDQEGRMTMSTDYFACGRVFCKQTFTYDEEGKLATNTLRHRFNGMQDVEVEKRQTNTLTDVYDEQGLLLLHHSFGKQGLTRITKHVYTRHAG